MKVVEEHVFYNEEDYEYNEPVLNYYIDEKLVFSISAGEPEDFSLKRDLNDCYCIPDMIKTAFLAGEKGETFNYEKRIIKEF